jgi:hypothetical protein
MGKVGIRGLCLGVVLAMSATAAWAFQEQQGAPAATAPPMSTDKPVELAPGGQATTGTAGTEVRIPGLGKLGVLPKMDFGLELLYGAAESKQQPVEGPPTNNEDLTIRGTVKHRF